MSKLKSASLLHLLFACNAFGLLVFMKFHSCCRAVSLPTLARSKLKQMTCYTNMWQCMLWGCAVPQARFKQNNSTKRGYDKVSCCHVVRFCINNSVLRLLQGESMSYRAWCQVGNYFICLYVTITRFLREPKVFNLVWDITKQPVSLIIKTIKRSNWNDSYWLLCPAVGWLLNRRLFSELCSGAGYLLRCWIVATVLCLSFVCPPQVSHKCASEFMWSREALIHTWIIRLVTGTVNLQFLNSFTEFFYFFFIF